MLAFCIVFVTVLFVCPLVLATGFLVVGSAKRMLDADLTLPVIVDIVAHAWFVPGWISDVAWNWTWGSVLLQSWPRQLTFSGHVQDLVDGPEGHSRDEAIWWAKRLNAVMPDHIHRLPTNV